MRRITLTAGASTMLLGALAAWPLHAQDVQKADRLEDLRRQLAQQTAQLESMREALDRQEESIASLRDALNEEFLDSQRGAGAQSPQTQLQAQTQTQAQAQTQTQTQAQTQAQTQTQAQAQPQTQTQPSTPDTAPAKPVGQAPARETRPPQVAQIFSEPTVLTQGGKFVVEPSLQSAYWASDRVTLVGYTVIPAVLVGLVDVRRVKTTTLVGALTARLGIGNRFEIEARAPYVYTNVDTVSREIFTGAAQDNVFNAEGHGLGDVDLTARVQLNPGDYSKPFWIGWLRYKWSTGKDPFEVVTDCVDRCVQNTTGTGLPLELPTGSGFDAAQAGLTWLYASDPAVFFGGLSYLYNFPRDNLTRTLLQGEEQFLGKVEPGAIYGLNVGMGLALNEKASFSIGYDQNIIDKTQQNGQEVPGAVRTTLGTLLIGISYRYNPSATLNLSLGVGVTRDTPDVTFTLRTPITF